MEPILVLLRGFSFEGLRLCRRRLRGFFGLRFWLRFLQLFRCICLIWVPFALVLVKATVVASVLFPPFALCKPSLAERKCLFQWLRLGNSAESADTAFHLSRRRTLSHSVLRFQRQFGQLLGRRLCLGCPRS